MGARVKYRGWMVWGMGGEGGQAGKLAAKKIWVRFKAAVEASCVCMWPDADKAAVVNY